MDFKIIILLTCVSLTITQLTKGEISYIKNYILKNQNQKNGFFLKKKKMLSDIQDKQFNL